ncbi:MAG: SDR family NAD(P)-dependent oxidoreductase [Alphaproteobacteria bacterium]|nr:SDR family NAD(P)-dependent oxidoreductase [Alphaproteobacteria bacterium]
MPSPKSILITGASSGIGAALARAYAAPGRTLFLTGRSTRRLAEMARVCEETGAVVQWRPLDVTDRAAMAAWIDEVDAQCPLDLLIANAGISAGVGAGGESEAQARKIYAVNVDGAINTVEPAWARMVARSAGRVAIMSSLASFYGFAGAPAYCASKAAVRLWGEELAETTGQAGGPQISIICPGFVRTPMTEINRFFMPGLMDADEAARIIRRGLDAGQGRIAFPWTLYIGVRALAALPAWMSGPLTTGLPRKEQNGC